MFGSAKWPFVRSSRPEMDRWNSLWPLLSGHVHAANTAHVRWLQWCGFEVAVTRSHGALLASPSTRLRGAPMCIAASV
jgi:hypothetical protein